MYSTVCATGTEQIVRLGLGSPTALAMSLLGEEPEPPLGPGLFALGHGCDVGQREGVEQFSHVFADVAPHGEQHALAFVVAGAVGVGVAEVAGLDRSVYGRHDLAESNVLGESGQ